MTTSTRLEHLFDMALEYRQGMARASTGLGQVGEYTGSGEGSVYGPKLNGIVRWDLFQDIDETPGRAAIQGFIRADDGVEIGFEVLGYMVREKGGRPTRWMVAGAIRFDAGQSHYNWLNNAPAALHGGYDLGANFHNYQVLLVKSSVDH